MKRYVYHGSETLLVPPSPEAPKLLHDGDIFETEHVIDHPDFEEFKEADHVGAPQGED